MLLFLTQSQESPRKAVSKERALEKKLENITEGYDTLAGISIELIEAMEATVSGEPVSYPEIHTCTSLMYVLMHVQEINNLRNLYTNMHYLL